jgi:hypothetical protein
MSGLLAPIATTLPAGGDPGWLPLGCTLGALAGAGGFIGGAIGFALWLLS